MSAVADPPRAEDSARPLPRAVAQALLPPLLTVVVGLLAGAALIALAGADPIAGYGDMIQGAFGSSYAFGQVLIVATPLLIIGLGLALAFRGRVYNIGAEGQLYMGGLAGGAVAVLLPLHNSPVLIFLSLLAGAVIGGLWGLIVAVLRNRWHVSEVISSLLLNYVAIYAFTYVIRKPLRDLTSQQLSGKAIPSVAQLPPVTSLSVHVGVFMALALVPVAMYMFNYTPFGFHVRMLGLNAETARAVGVPIRRLIAELMVISGALAGFAGAIQVLGVDLRIDTTISNNYGYTAIIVALLGGMRAGGVLLAALFLGALTVGGSSMSVDYSLPYSIVTAIQGIFIISLLMFARFGGKRA